MKGFILCGQLEIIERLSNWMEVYYEALWLRAQQCIFWTSFGRIYLSKSAWITDGYIAQIAIDSCDGIHLKRGCENFPLGVRWIHLVFSALEGVNLFFTLMVSSTVMVNIVFACPIWCSFYWRWRNLTTICFSSPLTTLIARRTQWGFESVEWNGKSIYFPFPSL